METVKPQDLRQEKACKNLVTVTRRKLIVKKILYKIFPFI